MSLLNQYVAAVTGGTREQFVKAQPHPFFLLKLETSTPANEEWSFQTRTIVGRAPDGKMALLNPEADKYRVFALAKMPGNPWPERISIGRARNNDVVLADNSVSKLHAHFIVGKDGSMFLADVGSRNGTRVNDKPLVSGEKAQVVWGDSLTIGALNLTLVDAKVVYDLVQAQLQRE